MKALAAERSRELDRVFAMLMAAARAGAVCPANRVIAERMGWSGVTTASRAIEHLERAGRIRVERTLAWRIVTIPDSGNRTAWNGRGRNPDPAVTARDDQRRMLARSQGGAAEQTRRRAAGMPVTALAIRPGFTGGPARRCQFIEGEPSPDDACKCGRAAEPGHSWCAAHLSRVRESEPRTPGWLRELAGGEPSDGGGVTGPAQAGSVAA